MTAQPFDRLAPTYDRDFTLSPIARYLRGRIHKRLSRLFKAGDHVLELGCGTGEDALYLASRGIRVLATDKSEAMLAAAHAKTRAEPLVRLAVLDLSTLTPDSLASSLRLSASPEVSPSFNGVFANFGVLNCLEDWHTLASALAACIPPGGTVAFGVMSPFCLWEMAWHGAHRDFKTAFRRQRRNTVFGDVPIHYPTIRQLTHDFAPHFRRVHVEAVGLFLPPSDVYGVIERRPVLLHALLRLERHLGHLTPLLADHYWIEFRHE